MRLLLVALLLCFVTTANAQDSVPDFSFTDHTGNEISSANTKGKVVVLNFWFVACKPCVAEMPELNEVYNEFKDRKDVVFAAVTFDTEEKVNKLLSKKKFNYPLVLDAQKVVEQFKVSAFPTNIVIDKNGNYLSRLDGGFEGIGHTITSSIQKALGIEEEHLHSPGHVIRAEGEQITQTLGPDTKFRNEAGAEISFENAVKMLESGNYEIKWDSDRVILVKK